MNFVKERLGRLCTYISIFSRFILGRSNQTIAVFPLVDDNPYQKLIYSSLSISIYNLDPKTALKMRRFGLINVYHLHWDEYIFSPTDRKQSQGSLKDIENFRALGGRVFWTMHNAFPHRVTNAEGRNAFLQNRQNLLQYCTAVHVHSQAAADLLNETCGPIDVPISVIPHPSYVGAYTVEARQPTQKPYHFLVFGLFHASKGIDLIAEGFNSLLDPKLVGTLHLAGRGAKEYSSKFDQNLNTKVTEGFIEDEDLPGIFANADFAVFGFSSTLTSGSLMLSISQGLLPIFPAYPSLLEEMPTSLQSLSYRPGDVSDFVRVLQVAFNLSEDECVELQSDCRSMAQRLEPKNISREVGCFLGVSF